MSMKGEARNSTFLRGVRTPKARRKYSRNKRLNATRARREVRLQPGSLTSHLALCAGTCTPDGPYSRGPKWTRWQDADVRADLYDVKSRKYTGATRGAKPCEIAGATAAAPMHTHVRIPSTCVWSSLVKYFITRCKYYYTRSRFIKYENNEFRRTEYSNDVTQQYAARRKIHIWNCAQKEWFCWKIQNFS